ncbi:Asd/ArgC dimerization domain-containing protein [Atopomonas sediminilitoris]|uniref:Asd/ArgC dimerization domain-containing protein n=1 Tax=Atopomonas sediminilitoris TaxID=2919919 RepID=UPI001F4DC510|nr:Asd/ArgC dimerization domain-containing protein [Atopomonas sediminilitoris]MCJ8168796.1 hypothetical protein [Atopomonas sediminilitoris]
MANKIALVGATSLVGEAVLEALQAQQIAFEQLITLDDGVDETSVARYGERNLRVRDLVAANLADVALVLLAAEQALAPALMQILSEANLPVLDLTGCWDGEYSAQGVVDVAARGAGVYRQQHSVTNLLLPVLSPLVAAYGCTQLHVHALLAVSEVGQAGVRELAAQTTSLLNARGADPKRLGKQLAFNVHPGFAGLSANQPLALESSVRNELRAQPQLANVPLSVRLMLAPVFFGHGINVLLQSEQVLDIEEVKALLQQQAGVLVVDENEDGWPTAVTESAGQDDLFVGRIEGVSGSDRHLNFWIVSDNVRRGVAYDAVQQTLTLIKHLL